MMLRSRDRAFTLVEMLTTIAVLVIVMGLMVSLTRRVRSQSAELLTTQLLQNLDRMMSQYYGPKGITLPRIKPLIVGGIPGDEATLQRNARINNEQFMELLRTTVAPGSKFFDELPLSIYDPGSAGRPASLRDAWGNPIVFMAGPHPLIGTAPGGTPFFFSAGPDGQFLTRTDNLYSYERALGASTSEQAQGGAPPESQEPHVGPAPTTQPAGSENAPSDEEGL